MHSHNLQFNWSHNWLLQLGQLLFSIPTHGKETLQLADTRSNTHTHKKRCWMSDEPIFVFEASKTRGRFRVNGYRRADSALVHSNLMPFAPVSKCQLTAEQCLVCVRSFQIFLFEFFNSNTRFEAKKRTYSIRVWSSKCKTCLKAEKGTRRSRSQGEVAVTAGRFKETSQDLFPPWMSFQSRCLPWTKMALSIHLLWTSMNQGEVVSRFMRLTHARLLFWPWMYVNSNCDGLWALSTGF